MNVVTVVESTFFEMGFAFGDLPSLLIWVASHELAELLVHDRMEVARLMAVTVLGDFEQAGPHSRDENVCPSARQRRSAPR